MKNRFQFNRMELAGSLGDLGTLLPLAIGMIMINGMHPLGVFSAIGIYYILAGLYFGVTVPVQPMKVVGAYAIATGMSVTRISASGILIAIFLLIIGGTNIISLIGKYVPKPVIRGVQISTGTLLMKQGVQLMIGTSTFQVLRHAVEPYFPLQHLGPIPVGIIIGVIGGIFTLMFLEHKTVPGGLLVLVFGLLLGLVFGTHEGLDQIRLGFHLPQILPFGLPGHADFMFVLFAVVLPQLPMTLGNAVIANSDLSREYFGLGSQKVTYRALTVSMALANILSFTLGGIPLCHGAGGLAAHYRFGARTAGSNLMIGALFLCLAVFLGIHTLSILCLIPMAILGVLLLFAGAQLAMTVIDMKTRKELFVVFLMLSISLASNLAYGFAAGIAAAYALKSDLLSV